MKLYQGEITLDHAISQLEQQQWIVITKRALLEQLRSAQVIRKTPFGHEVINPQAMASIMRTDDGGHTRNLGNGEAHHYNTRIVIKQKDGILWLAEFICQQRRINRPTTTAASPAGEERAA